MTVSRNDRGDVVVARPLRAVRLAAFLFGLSGVGIGGTTPFVLWNLASTGTLPMTPLGFRVLAGPFEQLGRGPFLVLGLALVGVSMLDVVAAVLLWHGRRRGAALGIATSPALFVLGIGFAVPFMLVTAPIRVALIIAGWKSLR